MKVKLLEILRCPNTGQRLYIEGAKDNLVEIDAGILVTKDQQYRYIIQNGIPRFVPQSNYADNFGMQWNHFRKTQLDSHSGVPISSERFWQATGWQPEEMKDQWVLDAGCGAGRFAEVALMAGANVVALDYSSAVDACYANLKHFPTLHVVQGDIYALPFVPESFPFVYSLGVLQHTPNVEKAFAALPPMVRREGHLCTDFYWKRFKTMMHAKYLFRPFTKRMAKPVLFEWLKRWVPSLLALSQTIGRLPLFGRALKRIIPVADYTGRFPLSDQQIKEWALLDTFDMLSPEYDNPQSIKTIKKWLDKYGLIKTNVKMAKGFNGPTATGEKPK